MRRGWVVAAALLCLGGGAVRAAINGPHIGYVYPAGGQQGTTFRVVVGGQLLRGTDEAYVSGPGVQARVVEYVRPLNNNELGDAAWFLRELVRRRWSLPVMRAAAASEDPPTLPDHAWLRDLDHKSPGELARLNNRLFDPRKQLNPQIADQVVVEIALAPDAPPGDRELLLATPSGLTNPLVFQVGVLPERCEEDLGAPADAEAPASDLPVTLNGQIMPGEVDHYRLRARQGQRLVLRMAARKLVPYLADAVPGWFQATMALRDPEGREVAFCDDYRFDPDPALFYTVPRDGLYELEVRDAIYRGREDFVYRVVVGELPFVTQVFPLGGTVGQPLAVTLSGWNLPPTSLPLDTSPGGDTIRSVLFGAERGLGSEVLYAVDDLPEVAETEDNDTGAQAQAVTLPVVVNGHLGRPGDVDVFRFTGRAGEEVVAEVLARRLGSPLDSRLRLLDASGREVVANDDFVDPERGLLTHHADSYLRAKLERDGAYLLCLSEAEQHGGEAYGYRLRLSAPRPDFALRLLPSAVSVRPGGAATVTVRALRKEGFAGEIAFALRAAPNGCTLSNTRLTADKDTANVTLRVPQGLPRQVFAVQVEGSATVGNATITRPAVPAEDMMQAFAYQQLVTQPEFLVAVTGSRAVPAVWRPVVPGFALASAMPVALPRGGTAEVRLRAPAVLPNHERTPLTRLHCEVGNPPRGIALAGVRVVPDGLVLTLRADSIIAQVGDEANVLVEVSQEPAPGPTAGAALARVPLGVLPAIAYRVVLP